MKFSMLSINFLGRQALFYHRTIPICSVGARYLFTPSALGVDGYLLVRERIGQQFNEMGDRFRAKMRDFVAPNSVNMVFTEDLKHMIHLADGNEADLELIEKMILKFNSQNKDLRFGSFIFGPVVMRMYYHLNRPKEALKLFMNEDLQPFFDQMVTYQILMDLLFKNEMYDEVLQVADIIRAKQLSGSRFPRNVVTLAVAAAYKKNTPEALQYVTELWAALQETGHVPVRRVVAFAAALAINQNAPHIALEILSTIIKQTYVTLRNLKVSALTDLNRLDDALPILRSVLEMEGPQENKHTFCSEVINKMILAVDKCDNKQVQQEFQRILDQLTQLGHISDQPLDNYLCTEIERVVFQQQQIRDQHVIGARFDNNRDRRQRSHYQYRRPSLSEME